MSDEAVSQRLAAVAAAIGEPARASMLCTLMDGRARTATELALAAGVSPSTASAHLARLTEAALLRLHAQGRHRYYRLADGSVAAMLEGLMGFSRASAPPFVPSTPPSLRLARTCYDHMAGSLAVALHDRLLDDGWLEGDEAYRLTPRGKQGLAALGADMAALQGRRRLACACLDWSERRPHVGGAVGAALLALSLRHGWVRRELDSRSLRITHAGAQALQRQLGVSLPAT